jgi:uncharacterized protein YbjT (DUF2867 family)
MNRILVTGATGTVGRQVVFQLTGTGAQIRVLVRNPEAAGLRQRLMWCGEISLFPKQ